MSRGQKTPLTEQDVLREKELAQLLYARSETLSKTQAREAVKILFSLITECLCRGQKVILTGFGTFTVTSRSGRIYWNPQTKGKVWADPTVTPVFRAGRELTREVKNHYDHQK